MQISVILPVYNAELYLSEALKSILNQTHKEFELICINDGSIDNSLKILYEFSNLDPRIVVVTRENKGLVYSLNEAISLSKHRYIARMDADDICELNRLEKQIKLMNKEDLAILGSSYSYIDTEGKKIGSRSLPTKNKMISWLMDFGSPLCHPSVMFDKELLGEELYYNASFRHCEDYELWLRCRSIGAKFGNLKESVFNYRILETSVSRKYNQKQKLASISLVNQYCSYIRNEAEADFLLYERSHRKDFKLIMKIFFRILRDFELAKATFVFLYLLK